MYIRWNIHIWKYMVMITNTDAVTALYSFLLSQDPGFHRKFEAAAMVC
jgi:hypothetical protein